MVELGQKHVGDWFFLHTIDMLALNEVDSFGQLVMTFRFYGSVPIKPLCITMSPDSSLMLAENVLMYGCNGSNRSIIELGLSTPNNY